LFPDIVMMFFFDFFIDIVFSPCCNKGYTYPVCFPGREAKRACAIFWPQSPRSRSETQIHGARTSTATVPVAKRNADIQGTHLGHNHPGREAKRRYTGHAPRLQLSRSRSETQIHGARISLQSSCS
jgi:hypothetical protein